MRSEFAAAARLKLASAGRMIARLEDANAYLTHVANIWIQDISDARGLDNRGACDLWRPLAAPTGGDHSEDPVQGRPEAGSMEVCRAGLAEAMPVALEPVASDRGIPIDLLKWGHPRQRRGLR
jgi:hypothetical protein